jgi:hypothetical protein
MRLACAALLVTGCFAPKPPNGALLCGDHNSCPDGYQCIEGACWKNGSGPDLAIAINDDLSMPVDAGEDMANADLASGDLNAADLTPYVLGDSYLGDCTPAPEVSALSANAHKRSLFTTNPGKTFGTLTTFHFSDAACSAPLFTVATTMSSMTMTAGPMPNTWIVTSTVQSVQARPETSGVAQIFNGVNNCGLTNWVAGVFNDTTGRTCGSAAIPMPGAIFQTYVQLTADTYESAGDATSDASAGWPPFGPPVSRLTCKLTAPQSGCTAPPRCGLPLYPDCVSAGALALGAVCDPRSDNCAAGSVCTPTPDGGATPQCRQICENGGDCTQVGPVSAPSVKAICFISLVSVEQRLCTLNCDPVSPTSQCPSDYNCHVFGLGLSTAHSDCVAPVGLATKGASCTSFHDCASGLECVGGGGGFHCRPYCRSGSGTTDCTGGDSCVNSGGAGAWGVCCPGAGC